MHETKNNKILSDCVRFYLRRDRKSFILVIDLKKSELKSDSCKIFLVVICWGMLKVIKIGSNVLNKNTGGPDLSVMRSLAKQVAKLISNGDKIILVSSGAVAFGRSRVKVSKKLDAVLARQIYSSVGQISLISGYQHIFQKLGLSVAQVLVTKSDFKDRKHYLNMRNCLLGLLDQGIVPILNENDCVSITELMFTDNDELASLTASMVSADSLILLTNVDGVYDGAPTDPDSKLLTSIGADPPKVSATKSSFGRGGMLTKISMAKKASDLGVKVFITNGKRKNVLLTPEPCTVFPPRSKPQSAKKWLAHGESYYKGEVVIDAGAKNALVSDKISSLLFVGISKINGDFAKGDIIKIVDQKGSKLGIGRAEFSRDIAVTKIGKKRERPFIHYDYLYLYE